MSSWLIPVIAAAAVGGLILAITILIGKLTAEARERGRLEAELTNTKKVLSNEQKASDAMVEHRSDDDTAGRMLRGDF